MTAARTRPPGHRRAAGKPGVDQALVTLFIGAMEANDRTTADEAERAQHLIWSTRRFRTRSGDAVGKLIEETRRLVAAGDSGTLMERAAKAIPRGLRRPAFAVLADVLLADGRLDRRERTFLQRIGTTMALRPDQVRGILETIQVKNQL
jgi:tellurite resistance protein